MKKNKCLIPFLAITLSLVSCGGSSSTSPDYSSLEPIKELFAQLKDNYNFTLESQNESNNKRKLEVFDKYCYYYSYQYRTSVGESGAFYIENQGVQDFVIKDNQINILFHEGIGKIDVVEEFTHDDYGDQFAHIPLSSLLNANYKKFKKTDDSFVSSDKDVNRIFAYFSNNYYCNWEKNNEDAYIDFSKSTTTIKIEDDKVKIVFYPKIKLSGHNYNFDGSFLTISNIGTTVNETISSYIANPKPLEKKTDYGFDETKFTATFGNATIPFSNKFSAYLDVVEMYKNSAINIYDINYENGVVEDIVTNIPSNWKIHDEDSAYWTETYGFTVNAYYTDSELEEIVEGVTTTSNIEVYFLFGICPVEQETTESGKILRPNGYFVGQIYRKMGEEAIEGYEKINEFFNNIGVNEFVPNFEKYASLPLTMRDYSDNPAVQASFAQSGYFLLGYYQIVFGSVTSSNINRVAKSLRDDFDAISYYSSVTLDDEYNLSVVPDVDKFAEESSFPMQALGSALKDQSGVIVSYQLLIICYTTIE